MRKRIQGLDALRGLAAIGVLLFHYTTRYDKLFHHAPGLLCFFPYGRYGVSLFFMISGFVIFMTLRHSRDGANFLLKRFSRLYPAYWTAILLTFTLVAIFTLPGRQVSWQTALLNLTMFHGFFGIDSVDGVYWTLQCELSFYIILFVVYCLRLMDRIEDIAMAWLAIQIASVKIPPSHALSMIKMVFILNNAHLFILGIIFYRVVEKKRWSLKNSCLIALCVLTQRLFGPWEGLFIVAIFFGTISYSLYLIHQNIGYIAMREMSRYGLDPNGTVVIAAAITVSLATAITFLVEKPAQRFINGRYGLPSPDFSHSAGE